MPTRHPFTLDRVVRLVIIIAIVFGAIWLINVLKDVLLPFLVAWLIAYLFEPFVQYNRRLLHLKGRTAAVFISLFEALMLLGIAVYVLTPLVVDELERSSLILTNYLNSKAVAGFLPAEIQQYLKHNIDFKYINRVLADQDWMPIISNAIKGVWGVITSGWNVVLAIVSWLIVVLYVIFIMIDYEKLYKGFQSLFPKRTRKVAGKVMHDIAYNMNHYFRGQALIAFIVGVLFAVGFSIIGLPMAIILGLFIGVLNLVPYLQVISILPTAMLCFIYSVSGGGDFWPLFGQCVVVYFVVQAIQDLFLTPKIMGKAMGLNPAIILLALSVWGTILGFIGLIIALPLTTLLISYYRYYIVAGIDNRDDGKPGATPDDLEDFDRAVESPLS